MNVRLRKDASRFDVSLTVSPIKDPSGPYLGASAIVDLRQLLQHCIEDHVPRAREKNLTLRSHFDPGVALISADPRRLDQVISNLLSNAIKFTPENGEVELGLCFREREAQVWVTDTGIGIPAEEIPHLFEKYRQTTNGKAPDQPGTGLGLVICKMIVEEHKGRKDLGAKRQQERDHFYV